MYPGNDYSIPLIVLLVSRCTAKHSVAQRRTAVLLYDVTCKVLPQCGEQHPVRHTGNHRVHVATLSQWLVSWSPSLPPNFYFFANYSAVLLCTAVLLCGHQRKHPNTLPACTPTPVYMAGTPTQARKGVLQFVQKNLVVHFTQNSKSPVS